jgi:hypothetical protein
MNNNLPNKFPCEPQEGLLEVIVRLGGDFEILNVLLSVEGDVASLNLALL